MVYRVWGNKERGKLEHNVFQGDTSGKLMKPCDDEDCIEGSGSSGEDITEPEHPATT